MTTAARRPQPPKLAGPMWLQVWQYAVRNQDTAGTVFLEAGQLRKAIGATESTTSRAIANAVAYGLLREGSSARMLWVKIG